MLRRSKNPAAIPSPPADDMTKLTELAEKATAKHLVAKGFVLGVIVAIGTTLFIIQNTDMAEMNWLWFDFKARLWLGLLMAFIAGGIASPLLWTGLRRLARQRSEQRKIINRIKRRRGSGSAPPGTLAPPKPAATKSSDATAQRP